MLFSQCKDLSNNLLEHKQVSEPAEAASAVAAAAATHKTVIRKITG